MYLQEAYLDVIPSGVRPVIYCSQYDNQTDAIRFTLYKGGQLFTVPDECAVVLEGSKPDNTAFVYSASSWSGSVVTINVTQQMTAVPGDVDCEIRVRTETEIIGSLNFILRVEPAALSDDSVLSETVIPLIEQAVDIAANLAEYIQDAIDAADAAELSATAAAGSASSAAIDAANVAAQYNSLEQLKQDTADAAQAAEDAAAALGNISAAATTLPAGSSATASYDDSTQVFSFGIPTGATGASGVTTPLAGFFTMWVDPDTGDLYAASEVDMSDYFSYDSETGNLYFLTEDGN